MKQNLTASTTCEGVILVAQCLKVDVASQSESAEEALSNQCEALELHFEPPFATIAPDLR